VGGGRNEVVVAAAMSERGGRNEVVVVAMRSDGERWFLSKEN
jgi:hypothetical protein